MPPPSLEALEGGARVVRDLHLVEQVVFVGGLAGCGKSLLAPVLGSFERVEIQKYSYPLEFICSLAVLGMLDEATITPLVNMLLDMDLYHLMQSRETNFRPSDCSSVFRNPNPWRYLRRLFQPGDAAAGVRIVQNRPILNMVICNLPVLSPPLFQALGHRMQVIEVVRHPLYMLKQWFGYIDTYGQDARDVAVWIDYQGQALPFFARGWEARYLRLCPMDRVIGAIAHLSALGQEAREGLSEAERTRWLRIPFERFVLDPWPYLCELEVFLGTKRTRATQRELKRQRVPRKRIADGAPLPIYKRCGWEPSVAGASEREELERRRRFAADHATREGLEELDRISQTYENTYLEGVL